MLEPAQTSCINLFYCVPVSLDRRHAPPGKQNGVHHGPQSGSRAVRTGLTTDEPKRSLHMCNMFRPCSGFKSEPIQGVPDGLMGASLQQPQ